MASDARLVIKKGRNIESYMHKGGIQYVDNLETYPYSLTSDSIEIHLADYNYKAHIRLHKDTLTLTDADGETRFWRFGK